MTSGVGSYAAELTRQLVQADAARNGLLEVEVRVGYFANGFHSQVAPPHFQRLIDTFKRLDIPVVETRITTYYYSNDVRYRITDGVGVWEIKDSIQIWDNADNNVRLAVNIERPFTLQGLTTLVSDINNVAQFTSNPPLTGALANALANEQQLSANPAIMPTLIALIRAITNPQVDVKRLLQSLDDVKAMASRGDIKYQRIIKRYSYTLAADFVRVELSKVTAGDDNEVREVEIEFIEPTGKPIRAESFIGGLDKGVVAYLKGVDKVLRYLWGTDILYTKSEQTRINRIVSKVLGEVNPKGDKIDRNLLTEARNLKMADLRTGGMVGGKLVMSCTRKVDGSRRLLIVGGASKGGKVIGVWLVFPPFEYNKIYDSSVEGYRAYNGFVVFDGEVVFPDAKNFGAPGVKYWYKIIDFLHENGEEVWRDVPNLAARQEHAQLVTNELSDGGYYPNSLQVNTKQFIGVGCSVDTFFQITTRMLNEPVDYKIDGLVFTPANYGYLMRPDLSLFLRAVVTDDGVTLYAIDKKKGTPVLFRGSKDFPFDYGTMLDSTNITNESIGDYRWDYGDKKLHLTVITDRIIPMNIGAAIGVWNIIRDPAAKHVELKRRKLTHHPDICKWKPPERLSIDFLAIDTGEGIKLYSAGKVKGTRDLFVGTPIFPFDYKTMLIPTHYPVEGKDTIIEYQWDYEKKWLYPFRPRPEKSGPNRTEVALDDWEAINQPITQDDIMGVSLGLMFRYHGDISWDLHTHAKGEYLLDIGSGKGGQVAKWKTVGYKRIIAVEPDENYRKKLKKRIARHHMEDRVYIYEGSGEDSTAIIAAVKRETEGYMVDVVTAINSLTFFWKDINTLRQLVATINGCIRPDTKFVWIMLDGERVRQMLEPAFGGERNNQLTFGKATITAERDGDNKLTGKVVVDLKTKLVGGITEWLTRASDLGQLLPECDWSDHHVADTNAFMPKHARTLSSLYSYGTWVINISQGKGMALPSPFSRGGRGRGTPAPSRGTLPAPTVAGTLVPSRGVGRGNLPAPSRGPSVLPAPSRGPSTPPSLPPPSLPPPSLPPPSLPAPNLPTPSRGTLPAPSRGVGRGNLPTPSLGPSTLPPSTLPPSTLALAPVQPFVPVPTPPVGVQPPTLAPIQSLTPIQPLTPLPAQKVVPPPSLLPPPSLTPAPPLSPLRSVTPTLAVPPKPLLSLTGFNDIEPISNFAMINKNIVPWYTNPNKEMVRMATERDGTCFMHSVLACIDPVYKTATAAVRKNLADKARREAADSLSLPSLVTPNAIQWETARRGVFMEIYANQINAITANTQTIEQYNRLKTQYKNELDLYRTLNPQSPEAKDLYTQALATYAQMIEINLTPDQMSAPLGSAAGPGLAELTFKQLTNDQRVRLFQRYGDKTPFDDGFEIGNNQDFSVPGLWDLFNSHACLGDEMITYLSELLGYDFYIIGANDQYIFNAAHAVQQSVKRPSIIILSLGGHYEAVGERDRTTGIVQTVFRPGDQGTQDTTLTAIRTLFFPDDPYNNAPVIGPDAIPFDLISLYTTIVDRLITPPPIRQVPELVYRTLEKTRSDGRGTGFPSPLFDFLWAHEDDMRNGILIPGVQIGNTPHQYYLTQSLRALQDSYRVTPPLQRKQVIQDIINKNATFIGKKGYGHNAEMNYERWATLQPIADAIRQQLGATDWPTTIAILQGIYNPQAANATQVRTSYDIVNQVYILEQEPTWTIISNINGATKAIAASLWEAISGEHPDLI